MFKRIFANVPPEEVWAVLLSVTVGVALLAAKFWAYFLTGSAAIFSDALESIVNVLASGFAMYALLYAHRPADSEHPYGHGKIEFMSGGFEGGMILLAAIVIAARAVEAFIHRPPLNDLRQGLLLMGGAMVINGAMGGHLVGKGRKSGSMALEADGWHLLTDAITSAAAMAALVIVRWTGFYLADPIAALLIAVYITITSMRLLRRSAAGLLDEQDQADEALLRRILDSHLAPDGKQPQICSYHKLRHRHSGRYHWVDFHILVPSQLTIQEGHAMASSIEYEIECALGEGNATAHVEPCEDKACRRCGKP